MTCLTGWQRETPVAGIDTALDSLKTAVNKAVEGMGSTATKLVDDMGILTPSILAIDP